MAEEKSLGEIHHLLEVLDLCNRKITDDPVILMFRQHPTPEQLQSVRNERDHQYVAFERGLAVETFRRYDQKRTTLFVDPDYNYLLTNVSQKLSIMEASFQDDLQSALTRLALAKDPQSQGLYISNVFVGNTKDRILEYYRWVAHGRKDDQFQFITHRLKANKPSRPADGLIEVRCSPPVYHEFEVLEIYRQGTGICCPNLSSEHTHSVFCGACAIRPRHDIVIGMKYYCDANCATKKKSLHAQECGELKNLYRVIALFTDISQYFEGRACRFTIASITEAAGLIKVQEKNPKDADVPGLQPCPTTAASPDQWRIVEKEFASTDWHNVMQILIKVLLHYTRACKKIRRMIFYPKNGYKTVQRALPNDKHVFNMLQTHEILCLTMTSGQEFAFDPNGARYGWREVLSPLADYVSQRVQDVCSEVKFASWDQEISRVRRVTTRHERGRGSSSVIEIARKIFYYKMTQKFVDSQRIWLDENDKNHEWDIQNIARMPIAMFIEMRTYSIDQVKQLVDRTLDETFTKWISVTDQWTVASQGA